MIKAFYRSGYFAPPWFWRSLNASSFTEGSFSRWQLSPPSTQAHRRTLRKVTPVSRCTRNNPDWGSICTVSFTATRLSVHPTEGSIPCEMKHTESFSALDKASRLSHWAFVRALTGHFHCFLSGGNCPSEVQCCCWLKNGCSVPARYMWDVLKITAK